MTRRFVVRRSALRPRRVPIDDVRSALPIDRGESFEARLDRAPVTVAVGISALLGSMPGPDSDDAARDAWLTAKADLLDRVADAAATPDLADQARACAAAARSALGTPLGRTP